MDKEYLVKGKIGVMLPTYFKDEEGIAWFKECVDSVHRQNDSDPGRSFQLKIYSVGDGVKLNQNSTRYTSIDLPVNIGWAKAANLAADLAINDGCDYIFTLNADDVMDPTCLARMLDLMLIGDLDWVNCYARTSEGAIMTPREGLSYLEEMENNYLTSFALFKAKVWQEMGGYDTRLTPPDLGVKWSYEDWDLWVRLLKAGKKYAVIKEPLYTYRIHPDQANKKVLPYDALIRNRIKMRNS